MPVVSASGLKGYIIYTYLPNGYGSKIALADEILLESVVGLSHREKQRLFIG